MDAVLEMALAYIIIKNELKTPEICLEAVRRDGLLVQLVRVEMQTEKLP